MQLRWDARLLDFTLVKLHKTSASDYNIKYWGCLTKILCPGKVYIISQNRYGLIESNYVLKEPKCLGLQSNVICSGLKNSMECILWSQEL